MFVIRNTNKRKMDSLPPDILKIILSSLNWDDFSNIRGTSKRLKGISNDVKLHKNYSLEISEHNIDDYENIMSVFQGIRIKGYQLSINAIHHIHNI